MKTGTFECLLHIAPTSGDNTQQPSQIDATSCATTTQQLPLKSASLLELARNKLCTKRATMANETVLQATSIHGVDVARTELTRLVRFYAEVNGFTEEEYDESLAEP